MMKKYVLVILFMSAAGCVLSCGSPNEKMVKFFEKGKALYAREDLAGARLEFKNAVQINPRFARGYYYLGLVERRAKDYRKAIGYFSKAVQLDESLLEAQVELGRMYMGGKATGKALETAESVLVESPDNAGAGCLKAAVLLQQGKSGEASGLLNRMLEDGVGDPEIFLLLALTALERNDRNGALDALRKGVTAYPDSVKLYVLLANVEALGGRFGEAEKLLQRIISLEPKHLEHRLKLGDLLWQSGAKVRARRMLSELIARDPKSEACRLQVARFYLVHKEHQEAEQLLKEGMAILPKSFKLRFALSELYLLQARANAACKVLEACLTMEGTPDDTNIVKAKNLLARTKLAKGEVAAAETMVDGVIKARPKDVDAHFIKGQLYLMRQQGGDAVPEFRTVVAERPEFVEGYLRLAAAHLLNSEDSLALDCLVRASDALPGSRKLHRELARLYIRQKDYSAAEKQFELILKSDPQNYATVADLVDLYVNSGQVDKALEVCRMRLAKDPWQASVHNLIGMVYLSKNEFMHAEQALNRAIELEPLWPGSYDNLAKVYLAQDRVDGAIEKFKATLAVNPRNPGAYLALSKLYEQKGAYRAAIEVYEKALAVFPNMWVAANNLAFLLCENARRPDDLATAEVWGRKAAELQPNDPMVQDTMAWIAFKQGDPDQAQWVMEKAMAKAPEEPALNYHMAAILAKSGKVKEAREKLMEALANGSRFPGRKAAQALLARLND